MPLKKTSTKIIDFVVKMCLQLLDMWSLIRVGKVKLFPIHFTSGIVSLHTFCKLRFEFQDLT